MITTRSNDEWHTLAGNPRDAGRALIDWVADISTMVRVVGSPDGVRELAYDVAEGSALWHLDRLSFALLARVAGGIPGTELTGTKVSRWFKARGDRDLVLRELSDELARLLYVLNIVSEVPGLTWAATSAQGLPYWHAERAFEALLTLLTGNEADGRRMRDMWSENQETTAWNLKMLAGEKRAASVLVAVAADGNTARVTLPGDGTLYEAGRVGGDSGLFWVTDEMGDVIGHAPAWLGVGRKLAEYYGLHETDAPVAVEYLADAQQQARA